MKYFPQMIRDLIRKDAFAMELGALEEPFFPEPEIVVDSFSSFAEKVFEFWGDDLFMACANYVQGNEPLMLCMRKSRSDVGKEEFFPEAPPQTELMDWLHERLGSLTKWHKRENRDLLIAPYIVQSSRVFKTIQELAQAGAVTPTAREIDLEDFLYTTPYLLSQPVPRAFPRAYYAAAFVIGIQLPHVTSQKTKYEALKDLYYLTEALSIKFQMSWGYPQLLKDREKMARKEAVHEQQKKVLDRFKQANDIARQLAVDLDPAFKRLDQLNRLLRPVPDALISTYRRVAPYIPEKDHMRYFCRWDFMHGWRVNEILQSPESFKAQLACVLLAYAGADVPLPIEGVVWDRREPWYMLQERTSEIEDLLTLIPTLKTALTKLETEGQVNSWDADDVGVFQTLKECFHFPFKTRDESGAELPERLTGPLLALWAIQHGGPESITPDVRRALFSDRARQGTGWPDLALLQETYSLLDDIVDEQAAVFESRNRFGVKIRTELNERSKLVGVQVSLPVPSQDTFRIFQKDLLNFRPLDDQGKSRGNFTSSLHSIYNLKGSVSTSNAEEQSLEIRLPIKS